MIAASWTTVTDAVWRLASTPAPTVDANDVTPGPAGFFIVAIIAVAVFLLIFDMLRRVRRVNYRAEINERLQAELDEQNASAEDGQGPADDPRSDGKPIQSP